MAELGQQGSNPFALLVDTGFSRLVGIEQSGHHIVADFQCQAAQLGAGGIGQLVGGEAHAKAKFGVVFKQRIVPGRPAPGSVGGVWRGRQIATVDRRTAGGVGNHHTVAE